MDLESETKMKKIIIVLLLGVAAVLYGKDITEVQNIDGSQRNQLTVTGGDGSSGAQTNAVNNWTSSQYITGYLGVNSNNFSSGSRTLIVRPAQGQTDNFALFYAPTGGAGGIAFGDTVGGGPNGSLNVTDLGSIQLDGGGTGFVDFFISMGANRFRMNTSTITLGASSSHTVTDNGATTSMPNGKMINSGVLYIPSSTSGTSTNANFTALSTYYSQSVLTPSTSVAIDFSGRDWQILNNATNVTLTTSNERAGKTINLMIFNDSISRTLTTPAGWVAGNAPIPTGLTANKLTTLTLVCTGNTEASTICFTSQQP